MRVVAPSGPFDARFVWRAMGWLATRYQVRYDRRIFEQEGYLAGSDERRAGEFRRALGEPNVGAIFCARGGYGANRFAHELDWHALRASPRWIVGFSDVTAFHVEATAVRVASIHGPNLTALGQGDAHSRERLVRLLESGPPTRHEGLVVLRAGEARGPLCGGNLALLHACAAARRLALPRGAVLMLEDVGERPYRLDRMLTTLRIGGHLDEVAAVVIGELDRCAHGPDGVEALAVLAECLAPLGIPVLAGLPVGHGQQNEPMMLGADAHVDGRGPSGALALS